MKIVILFFFLASAFGQEKISLEDIETDNLRMESKINSKPNRPEEMKYSTNLEYKQQQYKESSNVYEQSNNPKNSYTVPQSHENYNYEKVYGGANNYYENDLNGQNHNVASSGNGIARLVQYYTNIPKGDSQGTHDPNQSIYPSEVVVGNHMQSMQQKAAAEKYATNKDKGKVYVTIPMDQLLSYYLNLDVSQINAKSSAPHLQYDTNAESPQHISIPVYTPSFSQKVAYQIQPQYLSYSTPYSQHIHTQATLPAKSSKNLNTSSKSHSYVSHPQYIQQVIYAKPRMLYTQGTPIYTDLYARTPTYVQDNSLYSQAQQSHQVYVSSAVAEQLVKHILDEPEINSVSQNHAKKTLTTSNTSFTLPQYKAQKFKSSVTQLQPISTNNEILRNKQTDTQFFGPKSLLDSYIPSYVIAAQDSNRYKEKPIKLESGFLPSKINFIREYTKRKTI